MSVKVPIRTVFDGSTATGLAEYQSGEFIGLTHGGTGVSLSIGSAGQVLKVNSGGSALEFGAVEAIVNIDNATNLTANTLVVGDQILISDGGTEGRATLSQVATAIFASPTITGTAVMTNLDISGNVDIDGTLEADAITVNGATLTETITDLVGGMVSSNTETGITVTFQDADNTLDFALGAAQTTITSLLATDIKIGEDDQTKIDFETADEIHFYAANAEQVFVSDGVFGPETDSDVDLGTTGVRWKDAFIDTVTTTGNVTVGGDLTISGDDLTMATNTAGHLLIADGTNFNPTAVTDLTEISTIASDDVFLAIDTSGGGLKKVARSTVVSGLATSSAISNVVEDSTPQLGGNLDMNGKDIITLSNATLDLAPNGTGTVVVRGNSNSGAIVFNCESNSHGQTVQAQPHSASATNTMLLPEGANSTLVSLVSADTLTNKTLTAPTLTGTATVASLDISGDIDVDGTTNLDVVDIDGAVNMATTATITGNLTLGAQLIMPDVTSTKILVADGTSFQEVAISGDVTIANTGAVTIAATSVEGSMLNNNVISGQTALTSGLATTDELLVSDGGTLKRMDVSVLTALTDASAADSAVALAIALG